MIPATSSPAPGVSVMRWVHDGHDLSAVPVHAGYRATLETDDLDRLLAGGLRIYLWSLADYPDGGKHVRVPSSRSRRRPFLWLPELILGARRGERVRCKDGDPLNLRRENLELIPAGPSARLLMERR